MKNVNSNLAKKYGKPLSYTDGEHTQSKTSYAKKNASIMGNKKASKEAIMAYETYDKGGQMGSRHKFSTEMNGGDALTTRNNREKRDYMKSGRNEFAGKAQSNEKFQTRTESAGMGDYWSKLNYDKKGHHGAKFGTVKKQGS
jgi:hypothetical protein